MHLAAWSGHTSVAELLVGKGAIIDAINKDSKNPKQMAAQSGHTDTVELLTRKGTKPIAYRKQSQRRTRNVEIEGDRREVEEKVGE